MFDSGNEQEKDHQDTWENSKKDLMDGRMGDMTKANMGKDSSTGSSPGQDKGRAAIDGIKRQQWLELYGLDATAEILSIVDTGTLVNMDHVLQVTLKVRPAMIASDFETTGRTRVPRAVIPRVGDRIKIKYNPADTTQFILS